MVESVGCTPSPPRLKVLRPVSLPVPPVGLLGGVGVIPAPPPWAGFSGVPGTDSSPGQACQAVRSHPHPACGKCFLRAWLKTSAANCQPPLPPAPPQPLSTPPVRLHQKGSHLGLAPLLKKPQYATS